MGEHNLFRFTSLLIYSSRKKAQNKTNFLRKYKICVFPFAWKPFLALQWCPF
jgi:hypothetical protein